MREKETGGPAFPHDEIHDQVVPYRHLQAETGMSLRQYAAIKLRVPDSGTDWLDEMIRKSMRDDIAAKALTSIVAVVYSDNLSVETEDIVSRQAYCFADSMLKVRDAS